MSGSLASLRITPVDVSMLDAGIQAGQRQRSNDLAFQDRQQDQADKAEVRALNPLVIAGDPEAQRKLALLDPTRANALAGFLNTQRDQEWQTGQRRDDVMGRLAIAARRLPAGADRDRFVQERAAPYAKGLGIDLTGRSFSDQELDAYIAQATPVAKSVELDNNRVQPATGYGGGAPAAPASGGGYVDNMHRVESGGDPLARNQRSTATGPGQFLDGTFLEIAPRLFDTTGMTRDQILARRTDPTIAREATRLYGQDNAEFLGKAGLRTDDTGMALGHRFGPVGAMKVLKADPSTPLDQLFGPDVMRANPDLRGQTAGSITAWYEQQMGGGQRRAPGNQMAGPGAPSGGNGGAGQPGGGQGGQGSPIPAMRQGQPYTDGAPAGQMWAFSRPGLRQPDTLMDIPGARRPPSDQPSYSTHPVGDRILAINSRDPTQTVDVGAAPPRTPQVQIDQRGATAFEQTRGKAEAEMLDKIEAAGGAAPATLRRLAAAEADLQNITTGPGASSSITAGALAGRLGVPDAVLSQLGIDRNTVASGERIRSLTSQLLSGVLGSGEFPSNNFSNADREALERSLPSLANSPEGNRRMIAILKASAQRNAQVLQAWNGWRQTNGDDQASFRRFRSEVMPGLQSQDIIAPLLEGVASGQGSQQGGAGQGNGPARQPNRGAPQNLPRVASPDQARTLPPGSQFIAPNGQIGTVPSR